MGVELKLRVYSVITLAATTLLARSIASIFHVSNDSKNCIRRLEGNKPGKMLIRIIYLEKEVKIKI